MLTCPFCHTEVPDGAVVCRGCHAEIDYTRVKEKLWTTAGAAVLGFFLSMLFQNRFMGEGTVIIICMVVCGAAGGYLALKTFKDPTFSRIKKT